MSWEDIIKWANNEEELSTRKEWVDAFNKTHNDLRSMIHPDMFQDSPEVRAIDDMLIEVKKRVLKIVNEGRR